MSTLDIDHTYKIIADAPIGRHIGDRGSRIFAECANNLDFEDGEFLFKKGETTTSFYIIAEGRMALVKVKKKKDRPPTIIHVFEKGDMVGELSFIDDTKHSSTVMALSDTKILQFTSEKIRPLILKEPQIMFDFMRAVIKRVHRGVLGLNKQQEALANYIATAGKGRS